MNCQRFETAINDLARDQMMDAATRVRAQAHAETCARCAARLADERTLSAGLRQLAASAEPEVAPARVEARLLAAYREQHTAAPAFAPAIARAQLWPRAAVAVAAAVILAVLVLAAIRFAPSRELTSIESAAAWQPEPPVAIPMPIVPGPSPQAVVKNQAQPVLAVASRPARHPRVTTPRKRTEATDATDEIATEFMPLVQNGNLPALEAVQVVRVELPRTALLAFGLPMNPERVDERIKADVVVGNDGLARAIRFVR